jgi:hypothetical protein
MTAKNNVPCFFAPGKRLPIRASISHLEKSLSHP